MCWTHWPGKHHGVLVSAVVQPTGLDRLLTALRLIIRAEVPQFTFFATYEYSIQTVNGTMVSAAPIDTTLGLPSIQNMPIFPSILAESVTGIAVGQTCFVWFVNADPTRPEVVSLGQISDTSTVDATGTLTLGDTSTPAVQFAGGSYPYARLGDQITVIVPIPAPPPTISGIINGVIPFPGTMSGLPAGGAGIITGGKVGVDA